jgi:hypothetical protein
MIKRGTLAVPVIGVAKSGWQLRVAGEGAGSPLVLHRSARKRRGEVVPELKRLRP